MVVLVLLMAGSESRVPDLLMSGSESQLSDRRLRLLGGPGPPPGAVAQRPEEATAAFVRNEVTRRPRARDTTRDLEVPVITGEYEDDNKPSKLCGIEHLANKTAHSVAFWPKIGRCSFSLVTQNFRD